MTEQRKRDIAIDLVLLCSVIALAYHWGRLFVDLSP